MTLADLMPVRIGFFARPSKPSRPARRHRAADEVERQLAMRAGADLLIKGLRLQLAEQETLHAEVVARIDERHAEVVEGLEQQIAELERRLNVGVLAESVVTKTQELSLEEIRQHCVIPLHQAPFATTGPEWAPPSPAMQDGQPATP